MDNKKIIFQNGQDGFGHQLHGLHSLLILNEIDGYVFDSYNYLNKDFEFDHYDYNSFAPLIDYLKAGVDKYFDGKHKYHKSNYIIHPHSMIPESEYKNGYIYTFDNGFPLINKYLKDKRIHINYNRLIKSFNKNNEVYDNICMHLRLGDALLTKARLKKLILYTIKAIRLLNKINNNKNNIIIHTDGNIKIIENILKLYNINNYKIYGKELDILTVFDHMLNSKIFISSVSSLSTVAISLGKQEIVYVPKYFNYYVYGKELQVY